MKRAVFFLILVFGAVACSGTSAGTTVTVDSTDPAPSATGTTTTTTGASTSTSSTLATGVAAFAIQSVGFGESGWIEITNLGPDAGDPGGHWIASHPDYFEVPHAFVEPGDSIAITFGDARPRGIATRYPVGGTMLPLSAESGEVGLYDEGSFGDPSAVVDYLQWGRTPHFRTAVAIAGGAWPEDGVIVVTGASGALSATHQPTAGPDDWAVE